MADTPVIPPDARPRLAGKARLRFDRITGRYLLLYPEKGLALNPTAAEIASLCTGGHTVADMVDCLAVKYPQQRREVIERETQAFLTALGDRGLVRYEA
jgi:coenzyme PQQ biosynthesis protein PqqD